MCMLFVTKKKKKKVKNMRSNKLKIEREECINKTFRLKEQLVRDMEKLCDLKNISLNKLVDICIRYALDNLDNSGFAAGEYHISETEN